MNPTTVRFKGSRDCRPGAFFVSGDESPSTMLAPIGASVNYPAEKTLIPQIVDKMDGGKPPSTLGIIRVVSASDPFPDRRRWARQDAWLSKTGDRSPRIRGA